MAGILPAARKNRPWVGDAPISQCPFGSGAFSAGLEAQLYVSQDGRRYSLQTSSEEADQFTNIFRGQSAASRRRLRFANRFAAPGGKQTLVFLHDVAIGHAGNVITHGALKSFLPDAFAG